MRAAADPRSNHLRSRSKMLSLFDNALLQGLAYGVAVLGITIALRILRYPDLTADGSFLLGCVTYAASVHAGLSTAVAMSGACLAGAAAGTWTSFLNARLRVNRLLTGILTTMMSYSLAFRILGDKPNVGIPDDLSLFATARVFDNTETALGLHIHPASLALSFLIAAVAGGFVLRLLQSEWGLTLRATGQNPHLVEELGHGPATYQYLGLALSNGLVAAAGAVVSARQGFVDISMGVGVIIALVAALVIGEGLVRVIRGGARPTLGDRLLAAFAGATVYFLLYVLVLRGSISGILPFAINPTDLKFISALVVIVAVTLRMRNTGREEAFPL